MILVLGALSKPRTAANSRVCIVVFPTLGSCPPQALSPNKTNLWQRFEFALVTSMGVSVAGGFYNCILPGASVEREWRECAEGKVSFFFKQSWYLGPVLNFQ